MSLNITRLLNPMRYTFSVIVVPNGDHRDHFWMVDMSNFNAYLLPNMML